MTLSTQSLEILKRSEEYKANNMQVVKETQSNILSKNPLTKQVETIQTTLKSAGLGDAAKKAAQALSDKYHIVTFDTKGDISTIPSDNIIDLNINVGTGNKTDSAFKKSLEKIVETQQTTIASSGGLFSGITNAVNDFFNDIFKNDTAEPIPEEIAAVIDEIDSEIQRLNEEIASLEDSKISIARAAAGSRSNAADVKISEINSKIDSLKSQISGLVKKRTKLFLEHKTKTDLTDKIKIMIEDLKALSSVENLTVDLKVTIQEKIQEASQTIEKILAEKLPITQSLIDELNRAMLLANERYKEPIQKAQGEANANMDGMAEIIKLFPDIMNQKTDQEKALQLVADYKIQKLAIQIAISQGVFSK